MPRGLCGTTPAGTCCPTARSGFARDAGALIMLPIAYNIRAGVHLFAGEFTEAASMVAQAANHSDHRLRQQACAARRLTASVIIGCVAALAACSSSASPSATSTGSAAARQSTASGCKLTSSPPGASATTISAWIDPRLCAWAKSFSLFAPPPGTDDSLKAVQTAGKITVCAETDVRPIVYTNPSTGAVIGFEPDIMHQIAKILGIATVQYVNIPFVSYIPALQAHKCDMVMGGTGMTGQRAKAPSIEYTYPYIRFADVVIVKGTSPYKSLSSLRGQKIAVGAASVEAIEATKIAKTLGGGTSVAQYTSIDGPYLAVLNGTNAALVDLLATYKLHPDGSKLRALPGLVTPPADPESPYFPASGAAITSSSAGALNAAISIALAEMIKDGTLATILKKWNVYAPGVTSFIRPAG